MDDGYDALVEHTDPVVREIGQQLRNGEIRPRDLLRAPEYRPVLERGLSRLRAHDRPATGA